MCIYMFLKIVEATGESLFIFIFLLSIFYLFENFLNRIYIYV